MTTSWLLLIIAACCNAGANVLIKFAGEQATFSRSSFFFSWAFVTAIALFGLNFLAYAQSLRTLPLSVAYPLLISLTAFGLAFASVSFFGEKVGMQQISGYILLVVAIFLLSS